VEFDVISVPIGDYKQEMYFNKAMKCYFKTALLQITSSSASMFFQ